jgi:hypothetical protein
MYFVRVLRIAVLPLCFAMAVLANAQAPPGGGGGGGDPASVTQTHGYVTLHANVSCATENAKVSGTNVNMGASTMQSSQPWEEDPPPSAITNGRMDAYKVYVGSIQVYSWTLGQALPIGSRPPGSCSVRFASTNFNDGQSIALKIEATWSLQTWAKRGTDVYDAGTASISATRTVKAYNKGLALRTKEIVPPTGGYVVPSIPTTDNWDAISETAANSAISVLSSMKHGLLTGNTDLTKAKLQEYLPGMTAFFGFTHGESTNFRAVQTDSLTFSPVAGSEVAAAVARLGVVPDPNIVVLHACSTLATNSNGAYDVATAFRLTSGSTVIPNRAYAGFTQAVWSHTTNGNTLDKHATTVYNQLGSGSTVDAAVQLANKNYPPKNGNNQSLPMKVVGDGNARLINVYTGGADSPGWYRVSLQ